MNKKIKLILSIIVVILAISYIFITKLPNINIRIGYLENNHKNSIEASFRYFHGESDRTIKLEEGEVINFDYYIKEEEGSLELQIRDEEGNIIESKKGSNEGSIEINVSKTQKYKISILAEKARGEILIEWSKR